MIKLAFKTAAVAALLSTTSAMAATSGWVISEASGNVTITRDGKTLTGKKGTRLDEGDMVQTASKSRAVLVRGSEYVVVSPKAKLKIAEPEKVGPVTQIFQYLGNALFKIEKKSKPHFGVETPYMAAVVKGTTFNVSVSEEGTSVQVTEGAVEVITADDLEAALLTPGIVGVVEAGRVDDLVVIVGDDAGVNRDQIITRGNPSLVGSLNRAGSGAEVGVSISEDRGSNSGRSSQRDARPTGDGGSVSGVNLALNVPEYRDDAVTDGGIAAGSNQDEDGAQYLENDFAQDPALDAANEPDDELADELPVDGGDQDVVVDPEDDFDGAGKDGTAGEDEPDDDESMELEIGGDETEDSDTIGDDDYDDDAEEDEDDQGRGLGLGLGNGNGKGLGLGLGNGGDDDDDDDRDEDDVYDEDDEDDDGSDDEEAYDDDDDQGGDGPGNGLALGLGNGNGNGLALGLGLDNDDDQSAPEDDGEELNGPGNGRGLGLGNGNGPGLGLGLGNGEDEYTEFDDDEEYGQNRGRGRGRGNGRGNSN